MVLDVLASYTYHLALFDLDFAKSCVFRYHHWSILFYFKQRKMSIKEKAFEMLKANVKPVEVAKQLNLNENTVRGWKRELNEDKQPSAAVNSETLATLRNENETLQTKIKTLQNVANENATLKQRCKTLENDSNEKDKTMATLENSRNVLSNEITTLRNAINEKDKTLATLRNEIQRFQDNNKTAVNDAIGSTERLLSKNMELLKQQHAKEVDVYNERLIALDEVHKKLNKKIADLELENNNLSSTIEEIEVQKKANPTILTFAQNWMLEVIIYFEIALSVFGLWYTSEVPGLLFGLAVGLFALDSILTIKRRDSGESTENALRTYWAISALYAIIHFNTFSKYLKTDNLVFNPFITAFVMAVFVSLIGLQSVRQTVKKAYERA